jgi:hypothetical protein
LARALSEMVEKSVWATKRASVSVTGGGVAINSFLPFKDLLTQLSELGVSVYLW